MYTLQGIKGNKVKKRIQTVQLIIWKKVLFNPHIILNISNVCIGLVFSSSSSYKNDMIGYRCFIEYMASFTEPLLYATNYIHAVYLAAKAIKCQICCVCVCVMCLCILFCSVNSLFSLTPLALFQLLCEKINQIEMLNANINKGMLNISL